MDGKRRWSGSEFLITRAAMKKLRLRTSGDYDVLLAWNHSLHGEQKSRELPSPSHVTFVLYRVECWCGIQPVSIDFGGDDVDTYVIVYSVTDRLSFSYAQTCLADLKRRRKTTSTTSAVVLVANKQDLVRNRVVTESGHWWYNYLILDLTRKPAVANGSRIRWCIRSTWPRTTLKYIECNETLDVIGQI